MWWTVPATTTATPAPDRSHEQQHAHAHAASSYAVLIPLQAPTWQSIPAAPTTGSYGAVPAIMMMPGSSRVGGDTDMITTTTDNDRINKMARAQYLSVFIRLFTFIDGIFLLFWGIFYWPLLFPLMLVIAGYLGARYYRTELVALYLLYLLMETVLRFYWLVAQVDTRLFFNIITGIGIAISVYIMLLVLSFIQTIWSLTPHDRSMLRHLDAAWWSPQTSDYWANAPATFVYPITIAGQQQPQPQQQPWQEQQQQQQPWQQQQQQPWQPQQQPWQPQQQPWQQPDRPNHPPHHMSSVGTQAGGGPGGVVGAVGAVGGAVAPAVVDGGGGAAPVQQANEPRRDPSPPHAHVPIAAAE